MNSRISEEYFPTNTQNIRIDQRNNQNGQVNYPLRNNFVSSIIEKGQVAISQQQNFSQSVRNQSSPSPKLNQQNVITGRKLDNQASVINIISTKRAIPIQKFPIMVESARKRMNSDSESSLFTQRNNQLVVELGNAHEYNSGENFQMIKCESARPSSKNNIKSGLNFFSSIKKIPDQKIEYQLQPKCIGNQGQITQDMNQQKVEYIGTNEHFQNNNKNVIINNINNNQVENNHNQIESSKKKVKRKIDVKKNILISTLSQSTTNISKQISTNDGSNKENIGELIQIQQQQQLETISQSQVIQKQQKKHRKCASQTQSPNLYLNRDQQGTIKEQKKKKKNQLFIYSNLNSPSKKSIKKQLQLETSNGQVSLANQNEMIQPSSNNSTQIINIVGQDVGGDQNKNISVQFHNSKSKSTHCLLNNIYEQNSSETNQEYIGSIQNKSSIKNDDKEQKSSQQSSTTDINIIIKKKNKKNIQNDHGEIVKSTKNGQNQTRQVSLKKKRVQNSLGSNGSNSNYNHIIQNALKKQQQTNTQDKNGNEYNHSPQKKSHRQTASLINYNSSQRSLYNSSSQAQIIFQNEEIKRQKSEDFLTFINENALKIQREIEEKKKREEQEKQKRLIEKAQLKEKNESIRKKNLIRYTVKSGHQKSKNVQDTTAFNRMVPWGRDQQKLQKLFFRELQIRENQKQFYESQQQQYMDLTSPNNKSKLDSKQRRITLGLECLNQLNESAIQYLINTQKQRATQSVHLKDENKRTFSPEEKKQIQEFMASKKRQIDYDEDKRKRDKLLQQERLKLNLEHLKNEIKEQISSCKSSKGGNLQSSNNQQNSSSKKAKSSTRHVKSLTFSTPQFDNFHQQNSQYSSYLDSNQIQNQQGLQINLSPQQEDQVVEYLNEEYKKNFNWRDPLLEMNNQFQSSSNLHQNSINSNQREEVSIYNPNRNITSLSPQKSGSANKNGERRQIEKGYNQEYPDQFIQNQNFYNHNMKKANKKYPQKQIVDDNLTQYQKLMQQQYQKEMQRNYHSEYQPEDNRIYDQIYIQNQELNRDQQEQMMQMQFQERKNQLYAQYTNLSQRLQSQMVKSIQYQQQLQNQHQKQQVQHLQQYSHRNQIQEIQEEIQEQIEETDDISPIQHLQNTYDIPHQYHYEKDDETNEEKKLNKSFDKNQENSSLSSIKKPQNFNQINNNRISQKADSQPDESAKLDQSNNINTFENYKQSETSNQKNNSLSEQNSIKNDNTNIKIQIDNSVKQQQNIKDQSLNTQQNNLVHNQQQIQTNQHNQPISSQPKQNQLENKNQQQVKEQINQDNRQNVNSPSQQQNLVDEIPTIQSDASSNFQAQYENGQGDDQNSYEMNDEELEQYMYFNIAATFIQKVWRGFYTRKLLREFFQELEEMYLAQEEEDEEFRNQSKQQSSNSLQQERQSIKQNQEEQHYNKQNIGNNSDINKYSVQKNNIQNKIQNQDGYKQDINSDEYYKVNKQTNPKTNSNSNKIEDSSHSSDDNIQPILIDLNKHQQMINQQSKDLNNPLKNVAIQQKINNSPQQPNKNKSDDHSTPKNNSGIKKQGQSNQQEHQNSNQSTKTKNIISHADPNQKDTRKRIESLQMQEINEFSKSLVTLREFEKSSDLHIPSKNKFDYTLKEDQDNGEGNVEQLSPDLKKSISDYEFENKNEQSQNKNSQNKDNKEKDNQNIEEILGVAQKYQEGYKKMQEEYVNQWTQLISDLQSLQQSSKNQIDPDTIKKLCEKYENSKKHVMEEYQHMIQDEQIPIINQKELKGKQNKEKDQLQKIQIDKKKDEEDDRSAKKQSFQYDDSPLQIQKEHKKHGQSLKRDDKNPDANKMKHGLNSEQLQREQFAIAATLFKNNNTEGNENPSNLSNSDHKNIRISGLSQSMDSYENRGLQGNENKKSTPTHSHGEYIFEKMPFKQFTSEKYSKLMLKKESVEDLIKMREEVIHYQKEAKLEIINQMLEQKKVTPQIYEAKKRDIEQWVIKEKEKLIKNHHEIERGWKKFAETVRQTKRGIDFMKQVKKADNYKLLMNSSDESRFNKLLSFRIDSEASESDIYSERRDYNSLSFNLNNKINNSGITPTHGASFTGGVSPNNIKIVDQYQLQERPKKYLIPNQGQKYITGSKSNSAVYTSKSCTSWDGNILNTNNSEEVEYDDINDYLIKMKKQVAKHLPLHTLYGSIGKSHMPQSQVQAHNSQTDEYNIISPGFSKSHTPITKNADELNMKKKEQNTESEINDASKPSTPIKNFEISPNPKQKLVTQHTNTQISEPDLKRIGLLSLDSARSSLQSQGSSENQTGFQSQEFEPGRRLYGIDKKKSQEDQTEDTDDQDSRFKKETDTNRSETEIKSIKDVILSSQIPKIITNEDLKKEANPISDPVIEDQNDTSKEEIHAVKKQKEEQTHSTLTSNHNNHGHAHHNADIMTNALMNEVMPTVIEHKTQHEEKVIPIESCANLNNIKDFLVALAEFIKGKSFFQFKYAPTLLIINLMCDFFIKKIQFEGYQLFLKYLHPIKNFRDEFLGRVNQPLGIDPLEFLKTFNITENTEAQDTETSNAPIYPLVKYIHVQKPVVSEEIFLTFNELYQRMLRGQKRLENRNSNEDFDENRAEEDEDDDDIDIFNSQSDIEKYNLKLIFDCFNEALDFLRPYSLGGKPLPWKLNQKKLANNKIRDEDIERALGMAIGRTLKWGSCLCGFIPEKIEFPPGQDEENNEYLNQIKEDRLAQMLENEVLENEHKWLIYEEEETDVQLEIADDIFHYLMSETAQWLFLKMQGKLDLMDTLEITIGRDHKQNFEEMVEDEDDQKQLLDYQHIQEMYNNNNQTNKLYKVE